MKKVVLCFAFSSSLLSCMEHTPEPHRKNPLQQWREQQRHESDESIGMEQVAPSLQTKEGFITIDLEEDIEHDNNLSVLDLRKSTNATQTVSIDQWKKQLGDAIRHGKSSSLITLLSHEGQPATRGFHFTPYKDAHEQILAHKDQEIRILQNRPYKNAKYCTCCNPTFIWNRYIAPAAIIVAKGAQIGLGVWGIYRALTQSLAREPDNYIEAAKDAAPAIGTTLAALLGAPFALIDAWRRRILKKQQSKYEYYLMAEDSVKTRQELLAKVEDIQQTIHRIDPATTTRKMSTQEDQGSQSNSVDLDEALADNAGIILGEK